MQETRLVKELDKNIPFDKIRWVGNNLVVEKVLNSDNNYVNYKYNFHPPGHAWSSLSDCDPKNNPTSWNIFFRDTNRVGSFGNHPELLFDQFLKSDKREKRFLCLNRAPRPHRVELVLFLKSLSNQILLAPYYSLEKFRSFRIILSSTCLRYSGVIINRLPFASASFFLKLSCKSCT